MFKIVLEDLYCFQGISDVVHGVVKKLFNSTNSFQDKTASKGKRTFRFQIELFILEFIPPFLEIQSRIVYDDNKERVLFFIFCIVANDVWILSSWISSFSSCNSKIMLSATANNSSKSLYISLSISELATLTISLMLSVLDLRPTKIGNALGMFN